MSVGLFRSPKKGISSNACQEQQAPAAAAGSRTRCPPLPSHALLPRARRSLPRSRVAVWFSNVQSVPPGKYFWRLTRNKHLVSLQPAQIHRFWRGLPLNLDSLDAVYERTSDHKIVFFKGESKPGAGGGTCASLAAKDLGGGLASSAGGRHRTRRWVPPSTGAGESSSQGGAAVLLPQNQGRGVEEKLQPCKTEIFVFQE